MASDILTFAENQYLPALYGAQDDYLLRLEKLLDIQLINRGNELRLIGDKTAISLAKDLLEGLYARLARGEAVDDQDWQDCLTRLAHHGDEDSRLGAHADDEAGQGQGQAQDKGLAGAQSNQQTMPSLFKGGELSIETPKRRVVARSPNQQYFMELLQSKDLTFAIGPAGTGKTYLAVAAAVQALMKRQVDKIILTRPAVEAGERLGFLPGDMKEKVDPYLRPLYDALFELLSFDIAQRKLEAGEIEIAPLAFMRGRNLNNAFIIMDEGQNTTPMQMKMFLTRLGRDSRMVVVGDVSQIDLQGPQTSGLIDALGILKSIDSIGFCQLTAKDVVRHKLVAEIVKAYDHANEQNHSGTSHLPLPPAIGKAHNGSKNKG